MKLILLMSFFMFTSLSYSANKEFRKTQDIDFDGASIDGKVRTPDGSFLHQRRTISFDPLYKVKDHFDKNIKESVEYLR